MKKAFSLTGHNGAIYALAEGVLPDTIFSGSSDHYITQWSYKNNEALAVAKLPGYVYSLCPVPDRNMLLAGDSNGSLFIIDLSKTQQPRRIDHHKGGIFDIKIIRGRQLFITTSADGSIAVWNLQDFSLLKHIKLCDTKVRNIAINSTGDEMAISCGDESIRIFNLETLSQYIIANAHGLSVYAVQYHPTRSLLLSGGRDAHMKIWDTADDFNLIESIPAHNYAIYSIEFNQNGSVFATGSRDKTIKIWDAETMQLKVRINKEKFDGHLNSVNKLLWHHSGDLLFSAGDDRSIMAWEINITNRIES